MNQFDWLRSLPNRGWRGVAVTVSPEWLRSLPSGCGLTPSPWSPMVVGASNADSKVPSSASERDLYRDLYINLNFNRVLIGILNK